RNAPESAPIDASAPVVGYADERVSYASHVVEMFVSSTAGCSGPPVRPGRTGTTGTLPLVFASPS
ncbi:MAG: hypothetical protein AAF550_12050, partial [Myxococcota bacterium]